MDVASAKSKTQDLEERPFEIAEPSTQTVPVIFASPHSGDIYPEEFVAASRLDPVSLRRSEDAFVHDLFSSAPTYGAPLLMARFPRAFVDPNREPWELDPGMFTDDLPDFVNIHSPRVAAGLGTVARVVTDGEEIYAQKLTFEEAQWRVKRFYEPYHAALRGLIERTREKFGHCILIDCHSMPSVGGPMDRDPGSRRVEIVLGDRFGTACAPDFTGHVESILQKLGLKVTTNNPYPGGYTTDHYGRPRESVHALQIEINRALYMDENKIRRTRDFPRFAANIESLIAEIATPDVEKTLAA